MQKSHAVALKPKQTKKSKVDQSEVECFFHKKLRHWKRNCSEYLTFLDPNGPKKRNKQIIAGQDTYMIAPYNFSVCDTTTWVLDIESPTNICNSLQKLQISRKFENGERFLNIEDRRFVPILVLGIVSLF